MSVCFNTRLHVSGRFKSKDAYLMRLESKSDEVWGSFIWIQMCWYFTSDQNEPIRGSSLAFHLSSFCFLQTVMIQNHSLFLNRKYWKLYRGGGKKKPINLCYSSGRNSRSCCRNTRRMFVWCSDTDLSAYLAIIGYYY